MPTAVEYDPESSQLPAVQSPGGARNGLFLGGVFVMIIAVLIIVVCFGPSETLMSFVGCPNNGAGPGGQGQPGDNSALISLLRTANTLRGAFGQSQLPPPCFGVKSAISPTSGRVSTTPEPTEPVTPTGTDAPVSTEPATQPANPAGGPAPACTPNPGDGICSACENTDLDSASCVCNMNGVCDPQEGFNCGDCMPTSSGPGHPGKKSTPCPAGVACP